ncbi:MAG: SRPBCC family protein [Haloarculaceae archaeon]
MTVRVERAIEVGASREEVWAFIADPAKRAGAISVVEDWEVDADGGAVWSVKLPIPLLDRRIRIETRDVERRAPEYVKFEGRSKVMRVQGEHVLEETDTGTRLTNRFVVDGRVPGVERFFKRNLDTEIENLERALSEELR